MSDCICFLITVLYEDELLRCALKTSMDNLPGDCSEYPMEPENREMLHTLLPLHIRECGPIINVERLFDIHIANNGD